jgi:hypothetical protein
VGTRCRQRNKRTLEKEKFPNQLAKEKEEKPLSTT